MASSELIQRILKLSGDPAREPEYMEAMAEYLELGVSKSAADVIAEDWKANVKPLPDKKIQPKDVLARIDRILRSVRP